MVIISVGHWICCAWYYLGSMDSEFRGPDGEFKQGESTMRVCLFTIVRCLNTLFTERTNVVETTQRLDCLPKLFLHAGPQSCGFLVVCVFPAGLPGCD